MRCLIPGTFLREFCCYSLMGCLAGTFGLAWNTHAHAADEVRGRPVGHARDRVKGSATNRNLEFTLDSANGSFALFVFDGQEKHVPIRQVNTPTDDQKTPLYRLRVIKPPFVHNDFSATLGIRPNGELVKQPPRDSWALMPDGGTRSLRNQNVVIQVHKPGEIEVFIGFAGRNAVPLSTDHAPARHLTGDTRAAPMLAYEYDEANRKLVQQSCIERIPPRESDYRTGIPVGFRYVDEHIRGFSPSSQEIEGTVHLLDILADGTVVFRYGDAAQPFQHDRQNGERPKLIMAVSEDSDGPFIAAPGMIASILTQDAVYDFDKNLRVFRHQSGDVVTVETLKKADRQVIAAMEIATDRMECHRIVRAAGFSLISDGKDRELIREVIGEAAASRFDSALVAKPIGQVRPLTRWGQLNEQQKLQVFKNVMQTVRLKKARDRRLKGLLVTAAVIGAVLSIDISQIERRAGETKPAGFPLKLALKKSGQNLARQDVTIIYRTPLPQFSEKSSPVLRSNISGIVEFRVPNKSNLKIKIGSKTFERKYRSTITLDVVSDSTALK